jgi:cytochrome c oxidase assembly factor CtaG
MGLNTEAASQRRRGAADPPRDHGLRPWLCAVGVALVIVSLVPPVATLARRYLYAESFQFSMFAMVCPALIVLGAPWRLLRLSGRREAVRRGDEAPQPGETGAPARLADRPAASGDRRPSLLSGAVVLVGFIVVTLAWRLPPALDALARFPGLVAAEAVTLLAVGGGLWLKLVRSPPLAFRLPGVQRAVAAALAMWSVWIVAYALGFSSRPLVHAYAGGGLGAMADQQIAVGLVWGVAAVCFVPVIFAGGLSWLKHGADIGEEFGQAFPSAGVPAGVRGWGRPRRRHGDPPGQAGQ